MNPRLVALLLLLLMNTAPAILAQHHDEISRPRVGVISEQVARQKLISYGLDITRLERHAEIYVATVVRDGRRTVLEINGINGCVTENGNRVRLRPARKGVTRAIKPNPARVPWSKRAIRFDRIGAEGIREPAQPTIP